MAKRYLATIQEVPHAVQPRTPEEHFGRRLPPTKTLDLSTIIVKVYRVVNQFFLTLKPERSTAASCKEEIIMELLRYFFGALATVLNLVLTLYMWVIIARAVLSWVSPDPYNPIVRFIYNITEPVLSQIRRRLPVSFSGIDFSPIIVILVIIFLQNFVVNYLAHLSLP
jgi:YggT family protein